MARTHPAPQLPEKLAAASPELQVLNQALWEWVDAGSFDVKVTLLAGGHEAEVRLINHHLSVIIQAWAHYLDTLIT